MTVGEETQQQVRDEARRAADRFEQENVLPTFLLCGKTGAGKSSLLNALAGAAVQEVGVVPTTQAPGEVRLEEGALCLRAIDVAGFGEADRHEERLRVMLEQLRRVQLVLMVVGHPDRALEMESSFLDAMRKRAGSPELALPVVVAASKIDLANPAKVWEPASLDLDNPRTNKEHAIVQWRHYVAATLGRHLPTQVVACSASEFWNDRANQYGIDALRLTLYEALPEAARTWFARIVNDERLRERRANEIVLGSAGLAATAALQPVPLIPDACLIAPIQVAMITGIAVTYGADPRKVDAVKLLGPAVATMGGRLLFEQALKLIPGLGSVLGASVAGVITLSLGQAYHALIRNGVWAPSEHEFAAAFTRFYEKNKELRLEDLLARRQRRSGPTL
ncbi:DUF697 domain-containing protein [Pyxidicoccus fallax]|uniref:DUF697 domain-containing protein n=1 Tax=Pyxidicoccus fallax TaxID=394095 RepID=A0A848LM16_9BACT|nr:GTPase [Pyxidicoccus fallax]NMO18722.1 DUF697 domain-containing protein [Pyxidicoccus fallax]NPC79303.1 DUF697 domain-containing protein [Pyxidicoccus fallax]